MTPGEATYVNGAASAPHSDLAQAHAHFWRQRDDGIDVLPIYARTLRRWWKSISLAIIIASTATAIASKFYLTNWYQAVAIIRPVSQAAVMGQLMGLMGPLGSGNGTGVAGLLGSGGGSDADEYVGILTSFNFTRGMVVRHNLIHLFFPPPRPSMAEFAASRHLQWLAYRQMQARLTCEYSIKTGNISIEYQDTSPLLAETVMSYLVDDLRGLLRKKQRRDASAAIESLKGQARRSADPMIEAALYQLTATQIQRETLADVEADFAFTVIEAPAASDIKIWPSTKLFTLLAALMTFTLFSSFILFVLPALREPAPSPERSGSSAVLLTTPSDRSSPGNEAPSMAPGTPPTGKRDPL